MINFTLPRTTRLAGTFAVLVGLLMKNWTVIVFGDVVIMLGYIWTINRVEAFIDSQQENHRYRSSLKNAARHFTEEEDKENA